jgi:nicotinamidase-related amidase
MAIDYSITHIAMDLQSDFYRIYDNTARELIDKAIVPMPPHKYLEPLTRDELRQRAARKVELVDGVQNFAKKAKELGIPTIWPAYYADMNSDNIEQPPRRRKHFSDDAINKLSLAELNIPPDDLVFHKTDASCFKGGVLGKVLKDKNAAAIVFTGMDIEPCLADSGVDAARLGFNVVFLVDLIAYTHKLDEEHDAAWRASEMKRAIESRIAKMELSSNQQNEMLSRIRYTTSAQFFASTAISPAKPLNGIKRTVDLAR